MHSQEKQIYTAIIVSFIIIAIIVGYFIISLIRHQRRIVAANKRNFLAELTLLEKDRMRIAADLHDELCPVLTAVKFQVDSIDAVDEYDKQAIATSKQQIDFLSRRLRGISHDLMPATLTRKDLVTALQEYFNLIGNASGLKICFTHQLTSELPQDISINCYRIIQEITHNALKHAKATELLIRLNEKNNKLEVLCEDNGVGFNYNELIAKGTGLGLRNIKGRVDMISNNFNVFSVLGKGTQFTFDIPL